jgi:nucleotide-binding universal stress UspA family protein
VPTTPVPPGGPTDDGPTSGSGIVVGIDGSEGSRAALVWAVGEAARRGVDLVAVSAFPVDFYWADAYLLDPRRIDEVRADTEKRARAMVDDAQRDPVLADVPGVTGLPVRTVVVSGAPAEHLVQAAEDADLLVVGSRGRSGVRSTLLGSVALHCVTHARCPVVVVRPSPRPLPGVGGTVVVGLDDSEPSRDALRAAVDEAARLGADLEAVVAYHRPDQWSELYTLSAPPSGETHEHALRRGQQIVSDVLVGFGDGSRPEIRVVALEGRAGEVLARRAAEASLLVVGSRSRSRLAGMVLGSVALDSVVHSPVPVMVVHPGHVRPERAVASAAAGD